MKIKALFPCYLPSYHLKERFWSYFEVELFFQQRKIFCCIWCVRYQFTFTKKSTEFGVVYIY